MIDEGARRPTKRSRSWELFALAMWLHMHGDRHALAHVALTHDCPEALYPVAYSMLAGEVAPAARSLAKMSLKGAELLDAIFWWREIGKHAERAREAEAVTGVQVAQGINDRTAVLRGIDAFVRDERAKLGERLNVSPKTIEALMRDYLAFRESLPRDPPR